MNEINHQTSASSAQSGAVIIERKEQPDAQALRTAANMFRQAAKELDELDGMLQALYLAKLP